jgi:AraC-like DNA-binding protein
MSDHAAHTLPAGHALDLAELVESSWHVPKDQLFQGLSLTPAELAKPDARIGIAAFCALVERARTLSGEPAIGFHMGMQMRVPAHGYLGFAAMTASTLREALELATRYAPTRTSALRLTLTVEGESAALYIDELADFGTVRDCVLFALVVGLWQIAEGLTGQSLRGVAEFSFKKPAYAERLEQDAYTIGYDQPRTALRFSAALLDTPLRMANAAALELAREQCERALEALDPHDLVARVREALPRKPSGFHSLEEVAAKLRVSSRTLKRKLRAEGQAFSDLLDALALEQARELLKQQALSIEQVAERLGYSDVSNFGRAFRRWTGLTPAAFRRTD